MINKSAGVRNVFSSVHIERGRGFRCAELIHFGLQHFCLLCCSTHIALITIDKYPMYRIGNSSREQMP